MEKIVFEYKVKIKEKVSVREFFELYHLGKDKTNSIIYGEKLRVNDNIIKNPNYILQNGDKVIIECLYKKPEKYNINLTVLYEDDNILVINKPIKMLIHSDGNNENTLTNAVSNYLFKKGNKQYAFPVHRIDYDTTGIVLFAKDLLTLSFLSVEIEKHNFIKEYACLCYGEFKESSGVINSRIGKNRHNNFQIICKNGKEALTKYKVLKNDSISKVIVQIEHGRKHQIRVHMKHIGHPLVGDSIYGKNDESSLKLHFRKIEFNHPFKNRMVIECKEDF